MSRCRCRPLIFVLVRTTRVLGLDEVADCASFRLLFLAVLCGRVLLGRLLLGLLFLGGLLRLGWFLAWASRL